MSNTRTAQKFSIFSRKFISTINNLIDDQQFDYSVAFDYKLILSTVFKYILKPYRWSNYRDDEGNINQKYLPIGNSSSEIKLKNFPVLLKYVGTIYHKP